MRILVTGGAGYIGSRVVSYLLHSGHQVAVLDKLIFGGDGLIPFLDHPKFEFFKGDVRNIDDWQHATSVETHAIVHLAALVGETACDVDPNVTRDINRNATQTALDICESKNINRFLFVSTCSNYGVSDPEAPVDENAELKPLSLYSETKVDSEQLVLSWAGNTTTTVFRFGTICGLSNRMRFDLLVSELARNLVADELSSVFKLETWRPFLHVADAAEAIGHWLLKDSAEVNREVFNVVGENLQKRDLVNIVRNAAPEAKLEIVNEMGTDKRNYRVSGNKLEQRFNWSPQRSVQQAFEQTVEALGNNLFTHPKDENFKSVPTKESLA